jgi:hypothetical protein
VIIIHPLQRDDWYEFALKGDKWELRLLGIVKYLAEINAPPEVISWVIHNAEMLLIQGLREKETQTEKKLTCCQNEI